MSDEENQEVLSFSSEIPIITAPLSDGEMMTNRRIESTDGGQIAYYEYPEVDLVFRTLYCFQHDAQEDLVWAFKAGKISMAANCSDTFHWATADMEEITTGNLDILQQAHTDLVKLGHPGHLADLFCCRVRGMRPQGAVYERRLDEAVWSLFDACGPKRDVDKKPFGNPMDRPTRTTDL